MKTRISPLLLILIIALLLSACSAQPTATALPPTLDSTSVNATSSQAVFAPPTSQVNPTSTAFETPSPSIPETSIPPTEPPAATPVCTAPAALTPAMTEGPYYKADLPERSSLLGIGLTGTILTLSGYVLTPDCQPVAGAWLDFWQADAQGVYDNVTWTLRGHQYTDENGRYELVTVVPGQYPGRTEHIHFKVQAPGGQVLTSQLFFPEAQGNETDRIFDPALVIQVEDAGDQLIGTFNIVIVAEQ